MGGRGVPALASLFDKVACLRACKFIAERLWHRCFHAGIAQFLRTYFFVKHLVVASELSVLQKLFFEFRYFAFHYLTFEINIIYFVMI